MSPSARARTWAALAVIAVAAVLLRDALFFGRALYWRDIHLVWLPQVEVLLRTLGEGALPWWDRFTGFGRPLLADPRAAVLYPPTWLNLLPPARAYSLFAFLHLVWGGLGAGALARALGARPVAAGLAGALFAACGPFASLVLMWHHLAGASWMPWTLLATDRVLRAGGARATAVLAASVAFQVLAGSPDYCVLTLFAGGPLAAWRLWATATAPAARAARALAVLAGLALGLGLAAPQWLPFLAYEAAAGERPRPAGVWELHAPSLLETAVPASVWRLPLRADLAEAWWGRREPWLHSLHVGAPALGLALVGLAVAGGPRSALAAILIGALLAACGAQGGLLVVLEALAPPLRELRYPVKALVPAALALALLAARGLDALAATATRAPWIALAAVPGALAAAWAASDAAAAAVSPDGGAALQAFARAGLAAVALALTAAALARFASRPLPFALLAALVPGCPLLAHHDLFATAPAALLGRRPALLAHLDPAAAGRLYAYDYLIVDEYQRVTSPLAPQALDVVRLPPGFDAGAALVAGAHEALHPPTAARFGLAGSFDHDILDFEPAERRALVRALRAHEGSPRHRALLRIGAVTHAVGMGQAAWWDGLTPVAQATSPLRFPVTLLQVPGPLPRAYAVSEVLPVSGLAAIEALTAPGFDPARQVVLEPDDARRVPDAGVGPGRAGQVAIRDLRGDRVALDVDMARAGVVVLVDAWSAGWRARVDGQPADVLRANVAFRAVPVGAGHHAVELSYEPLGLRTGVAIALGALAVLATLLLRRPAA